MKKKYKLRVRGRFLNTKLLGEECSAPPWLALLQKRWRLNESIFYHFSLSARLCLKLPFILVALVAVLFVLVYVGIISMLMGVAIISPVFLVWVCAYCVSRVRACIMAGDVRCYLAHVKNYHKPYASIEFSNGHIEKRLFVYTAGENPIKPGDEVYVCVIECDNLQFCEVRPARKLRKVQNRNPKKEKKLEKEEATCQKNRKREYVSAKKKFESRAGEKMLDLKQLGKECSVPPRDSSSRKTTANH